MNLPDFSQTQRTQLTGLGLCDQQIERLRNVLEPIKIVHTQFAAHSEVKALLKKVESHSRQLARILKKLHWCPEPKELMKYAEANNIVSSCLPVERSLNRSTEPLRQTLECLAINLNEELKSPTPPPRRKKTTSSVVIGHIDQALRKGWEEMYPSGKPTYPKKMRVAADESSDFLAVARICYKAAKVKGDPIRSIRSYMKPHF